MKRTVSKRIREVLAYLPPEEGAAGLIERLVDCGALRVLNEDNANLYYTVFATEEEWPVGWHLTPTAALADAIAALEQRLEQALASLNTEQVARIAAEFKLVEALAEPTEREAREIVYRGLTQAELAAASQLISARRARLMEE